jgi:hypothetical protein
MRMVCHCACASLTLSKTHALAPESMSVNEQCPEAKYGCMDKSTHFLTIEINLPQRGNFQKKN